MPLAAVSNRSKAAPYSTTSSARRSEPAPEGRLRITEQVLLVWRAPSLGLSRSLGGLLGALLQLGHREILLVRGEVPDMAEGIAERPGAVAVELVLHGLHDRAARFRRALHHLVGVRHVEMDRHRGAAARGRAQEIDPGI